jgi:arylsulfatase A-like enzyme
MSTSNHRRILIFGADGLRPDLLDPKLMPTVAQLAATGAHSPEHHAVYPTHTRVNISALATGTTPGRHGIVANTMIVPPIERQPVTDDHIIDTSDYRHLNALERASRGQALLISSLGDMLAARNERLAVAATSSPGAAMLWTHRHLSRMVNTNTAYGIADLYDLREKLGPTPERVPGPQIDAQRYAARAVTEIYLDDPQNRVIVFWMCEPDASLHRYGLGSPETREAMRAVDACVSAVLAELDRRGLREQFDIFFLSDHGHSTVLAHSTLRDYLQRAQQEIGRPLPPLVTASDYVYSTPGADEPGADALAPLVEWLLAQPWTGAVLGGRADLATLPGVVPLDAVWNNRINKRRPLLAVSPRWSADVNEHGVPGTVQSLTTQSALRSSHGSASPFDLHAVFIAHGPSFREGATALPTGAVDLLPTILTLLHMPLPDRLDGRVLWEILREPQGEPGETQLEFIEPQQPAASAATPAQLALHRVGDATYFHGALQADAEYARSSP